MTDGIRPEKEEVFMCIKFSFFFFNFVLFFYLFYFKGSLAISEKF